MGMFEMVSTLRCYVDIELGQSSNLDCLCLRLRSKGPNLNDRVTTLQNYPDVKPIGRSRGGMGVLGRRHLYRPTSNPTRLE